MLMLAVMMFVMVAVTVSTAFRLKGGLDRLKMCPEAAEHVFDHVVGPNPKNAVSNLRRQVSIAEVPGKTHQLFLIFMPDFDDLLWSGLNL
jgi:hypothetical protein